MDQKMYLTKDGFERLKTELEALVNVKRKEISKKIKRAKEFGDLSENAEYAEAKEEQSFIEGRIQELEHVLKNSEVLTKSGKRSCNIVDVGCTVHVTLESGDMKLRIVGSAEADPENGFISFESPIGKALMGRKAGEEVDVEVPAGTIKYKIKHIES